jgi:hypothetical protein
MGAPQAQRVLNCLPESRRVGIHGTLACLRATVGGLRLPANRATGQLADGQEFSVLAYGPPARHERFLQHLFGGRFDWTPACMQSLPGVLCGSPDELPADVILCPVNPWTARLFERREWHILLTWIDCCLRLEPNAESVLRAISYSLRREFRIAHETGLTVHTGGDAGDLEEFLTRMYEPTVRRRHGDQGIHIDADVIRSYFQKGRLVKVFQGDDWIAGGVIVHRPSELWLPIVGWLQGNAEYLNSHVVALLYRRALEYAEEGGFPRVNFGACRGFVQDGVLQYKMKWRMRPEIRRFQYSGQKLWGPVHDMCAAIFRVERESVRAVLHRHPMFARAGKGLQILTWNRERPSLFDHLGNSLLWNNLAQREIAPVTTAGSEGSARDSG